MAKKYDIVSVIDSDAFTYQLYTDMSGTTTGTSEVTGVVDSPPLEFRNFSYTITSNVTAGGSVRAAWIREYYDGYASSNYLEAYFQTTRGATVNSQLRLRRFINGIIEDEDSFIIDTGVSAYGTRNILVEKIGNTYTLSQDGVVVCSITSSNNTVTVPVSPLDAFESNPEQVFVTNLQYTS